jgi:phenylalanyl-tRNA synthetase beta chain
MDIWDLKHHFELAASVASPGARIVPAGGEDLWQAETADGRIVGRATRLVVDAPPWAGAVLGFELEIDPGGTVPIRYRPLPTQPPSVRDLSLVLPDGLRAEEVDACVRAAGGPLLEQLEVLDEYRGPNVAAGTRGVTWRCVFRDPGRTLRDNEVDALVDRVLARLEGELHVRRRAG